MPIIATTSIVIQDEELRGADKHPPKHLYKVCSDTAIIFHQLASLIGVGRTRGRSRRDRCPPPLKIEKYYSGNLHEKYGHFVNFSYIFSGKNVSPKVD